MYTVVTPRVPIQAFAHNHTAYHWKLLFLEKQPNLIASYTKWGCNKNYTQRKRRKTINLAYACAAVANTMLKLLKQDSIVNIHPLPPQPHFRWECEQNAPLHKQRRQKQQEMTGYTPSIKMWSTQHIQNKKTSSLTLQTLRMKSVMHTCAQNTQYRAQSGTSSSKNVMVMMVRIVGGKRTTDVSVEAATALLIASWLRDVHWDNVEPSKHW